MNSKKARALRKLTRQYRINGDQIIKDERHYKALKENYKHLEEEKRSKIK